MSQSLSFRGVQRIDNASDSSSSSATDAKGGCKWSADMCHNGCVYHIGVYTTPEDAARNWDVLWWAYKLQTHALNFEADVCLYEHVTPAIKTHWDVRMERQKITELEVDPNPTRDFDEKYRELAILLV